MKKYEKIAEEKDRLQKLYRVEKWTLGEIADEYGVSHYTIRNAFDEAGLERRSPGGGSRGVTHEYERLANEEADRLRELYFRELLEAREIADEFSVSSDTIYRAFEHAGIETCAQYKRVAEGYNLKEL
jgi:DNA-binding transcriptional regulator LsrR (DeoR family)